MLQPHSILWHYLWVGPNVLQLGLAIFTWRSLRKHFPAFLAYLVYGAIETFTLWTMDVLPLSWVSVTAYWRAAFAGAVIEGLLTFAIIWELFFHLVRSRSPEAKEGKRRLIVTGVVLVLFAALAAGRTPVVPKQLVLIARVNDFLMALYMVLSGLILLLFLFAAYRGLVLDRRALGIALGLGIDWCEHTAGWTLIAHRSLGPRSYLLDFLNMGTYHAAVLIWFYYLLSPGWTNASQSRTTALSDTETDAHTDSPDWRLQWVWLLSKS